GALLAGIPLLMGGLGSFCTARSSEYLVLRTGSVARARRLMAGGGFAAAAFFVLLPTRIEHPVGVMIALGVASFLADFVIPVSWSTCIDVGGRFAGTFSGSMNMMGNLGGALTSWVTGKLIERTHGDF